MFTGIIQAKGSIAALERRGGDVRLSVQSDGLPFASYDVGESIAVNGVCLTAVALRDDGFDTDVSVETLDVTSLGGLGIGNSVNLEPSLSLGDRLVKAAAVLDDLGRRGINDVLVEAGPALAGNLISNDLVDELVIYQAPHIMGSETMGMFRTPTWTELSDRRSLDIIDTCQVGPDTRITARIAG